MLKIITCSLFLAKFGLSNLGCDTDGDSMKNGKPYTFTPADACKVLVRDLQIPVDSVLGKALLAEEFSGKILG